VETAFASGDVVAVAELAAERRWPRASRAFPDELVSVVAAPVWSGDGPVGTLSAYGRRPDAVPAESVELLAVTLGGVLRELELADELTRLEDNKNRALTSRAVIDQAKGIVMAARGIDADAAWDHLVKVSNVQQIKIRDLAASIVERAAQRS
jgi:hypothetical protein